MSEDLRKETERLTEISEEELAEAKKIAKSFQDLGEDIGKLEKEIDAYLDTGED